MKIRSVTARVCNAELRNWVLVRVGTDQAGLFGWGEARLEFKTRAVIGAIEDMSRCSSVAIPVTSSMISRS